MEKELEACLSTPDRVGSIFIRYVSARAFFGTSLCSFVLKFCVCVLSIFFSSFFVVPLSSCTLLPLVGRVVWGGEKGSSLFAIISSLE